MTLAEAALSRPDATSVTSSTSATPTETSRSSPAGAFIEQVGFSCGDAPAARQFGSALHVELASDGFTPPDPGTRVLRCDVDTGTLTLLFANRELQLDVSDIPHAARARTLAVALAETLRMPPSELPPPAAPPAPSGERLTTAPTAPSGERLTAAPADQNKAQPPPRQPTSGAAPSGAAAAGPSPRATAAPLRSPAEWQLPIALRGAVMGPQQTLALGATLGASARLTQRFRGGVNLGYLTALNRSLLGAAQLHAVNLEGTFDVTVTHPSANTAIDVGVGAGVYRALVTVESAWGFDEPNLAAWFAVGDLHAQLSTTVSEDLCLLTHLRGVRDIAGLRLRAGGQEAMSFHGFGAELRLGAAYTW